MCKVTLQWSNMAEGFLWQICTILLQCILWSTSSWAQMMTTMTSFRVLPHVLIVRAAVAHFRFFRLLLLVLVACLTLCVLCCVVWVVWLLFGSSWVLMELIGFYFNISFHDCSLYSYWMAFSIRSCFQKKITKIGLLDFLQNSCHSWWSWWDLTWNLQDFAVWDSHLRQQTGSKQP